MRVLMHTAGSAYLLALLADGHMAIPAVLELRERLLLRVRMVALIWHLPA